MAVRRILIETVFFSAALAAVVLIVFVPPPVEVADNGDSPKMIARFALLAEAASANDAPRYLSLRYVKDPKVWWVSENYSAEVPLIGIAVAICDRLGWG